MPFQAELSTSQFTYSEGPAAGSPFQQLPIVAKKQLASLLRLVCSVKIGTGRRTPTHRAPVPRRGIEYSLLQKRSHFSEAPKLKEDPGQVKVVPAWIARIEPEGDLNCGQGVFRVPDTCLNPGPDDLDHVIVRVHRPGKIDVTLGTIELTPCAQIWPSVKCTRGSFGSDPSACSANLSAAIRFSSLLFWHPHPRI